MLLVAGCGDDNVAVENDASPLLIAAAELGEEKIVSDLISKRSPVDVRDSCRWTPLMKAALNGHTAIVKKLLDAGAAIELCDKGGYTALMLAASNNQADTVALLLDYGADPNRVEQTRGWTALIWAAKQGHLETVELLLRRGASPHAAGFDGKTALQWATENSHDLVVARLGNP